MKSDDGRSLFEVIGNSEEVIGLLPQSKPDGFASS